MGSTFWRSIILKCRRFEAVDFKVVNRTAKADEYVKQSYFFFTFSCWSQRQSLINYSVNCYLNDSMKSMCTV